MPISLASTLTLLVAVFVFLLPVSATADNPAEYEARRSYQRAVANIREGRRKEFDRERQALAGYVLEPYLTYHDLRNRLSRVSAAEINRFHSDHSQLPVAHLLFQQWLQAQAANRHWSTFLANYQPSESIEMQCLYLQALFGTDRKDQALDQAGTIWVSGQSLPKACNPLFEVWQTTPRMTQDLVWARTSLAIAANERTLARYLQRFLHDEYQVWGQAYYSVHLQPSVLEKTANFKTDSALSREVIVHGLKRLADNDPEAANLAWTSYRLTHRFDRRQLDEVNTALYLALAKAGQFPAIDPADAGPALSEGLAAAAVNTSNWAQALRWITAMPVSERSKDRWQYWLGRAALKQIDTDPQAAAQATIRLAELAQKRTYYGFLAANLRGSETHANDSSLAPENLNFVRLYKHTGVARMLELFAVGDDLNARRELNGLNQTLNPGEQLDLAYLLLSIGESALAIRSANSSDLLDYLDLRFPMLFVNDFRRASHESGVALPFLMAIARQESAFDPHARSSADARGLMQMLPATARMAAARATLPTPATNALYDPGVNIRLGAAHLAWLLNRYQQHMPLAAAAYNAGEHRVDRWLKDASGKPTDVWIESIPYRETRNYVKNVISFNQVYGHRLKALHPVFQAHEDTIP